MEFKFNKEALENVNLDSDLFYDLTDGGYIDPEKILEDKGVAKKITEAADLVKSFFQAMQDAMDF